MTLIANFMLIIFLICAVLLVLLVLVQDDQGEGMGGLFSSGSTQAFRTRSGNLLQNMTTGVSIFFFVSAIGFALLTKPVDPLHNLEFSNEPQNGLLNEIEAIATSEQGISVHDEESGLSPLKENE
jgi:preprotein translocase subunit SecG